MFGRKHRQRKAVIAKLVRGWADAEKDCRLSDVTVYSQALYAATACMPARYQEIATRALVTARETS